jgi:sensor histidine kinase YesM
MGERLQFEIEVPPQLLGAPVPPMMLATLVENAIKHGVGPLAEGGSIRVRAAAEGGVLKLEVADDGRGFAAGSGSGVGLANIRARLNELHGARAALLLEAAAPRGVVATIALPLHRAGGTS